MQRRIIQVDNPDSYKQLVTVEVTVTAPPDTKVTDLLLQAGTTATGWVPNVTEMPWTSGVTQP